MKTSLTLSRPQRAEVPDEAQETFPGHQGLRPPSAFESAIFFLICTFGVDSRGKRCSCLRRRFCGACDGCPLEVAGWNVGSNLELQISFRSISRLREATQKNNDGWQSGCGRGGQVWVGPNSPVIPGWWFGVFADDVVWQSSVRVRQSGLRSSRSNSKTSWRRQGKIILRLGPCTRSQKTSSRSTTALCLIRRCREFCFGVSQIDHEHSR